MREFKIHFREHGRGYSICGNDGAYNYNVGSVTCGACQRKLLEEVAPWARRFLRDLRKRAVGRAQAKAVRIPAGPTEPVNAVIDECCTRAATPFHQQSFFEESIRKILPPPAAATGPIEPIVHDGGATAGAIGVEPGQVAESPWDRR